MAIHFFSEQTRFSVPKPKKTISWIKSVAQAEGANLEAVNYIFCPDEYLREINVQYLNHDTYTDIVTFNYGSNDTIEGDIFISLDRVKDNAEKFGTDFDTELRRVMVHGVLHLMGYNDKSKTEKKLMREKEDSYLSLWS